MKINRIILGNTQRLQGKNGVCSSVSAFFHSAAGKKKRNRGLALLIIIIVMSHSLLLGYIESIPLDYFHFVPIQATGSLEISVRGVDTRYPGTISITADGIKITCLQSIFAPVNDFTARRSKTLVIQPTDYPYMDIYENDIVIYTGDKFFKRYRHLFVKIEKGSFLRSTQSDGLLYIFDKPPLFEERIQGVIKKVLAPFLSRWFDWLTRAILILPGFQ